MERAKNMLSVYATSGEDLGLRFGGKFNYIFLKTFHKILRHGTRHS